MDIVVAKRHFLKYLEIECGRSPKTIENYSRYLERFFSFSNRRSVGLITEKCINEYRLYLNRRLGVQRGTQRGSMKHTTQNYHLIAVRAFLKFLRLRGVAVIPPEQIKLVKVSKRSLNPISPAELARLRFAPRVDSLDGKRDRAILELLCSTGLRISELCNLSVNDITFSNSTLSVRRKGDTIRRVTLTKKARETVRDYLQSRTDHADALFVRYGRKAHLGKDPRITPRTVQRLLQHYAVTVGITSRVTPQICRQSLATDLLQNGAALHSVQRLLGHAHVSTTQFYARAADVSASIVQSKTHSRAKQQ